VRIGEQAGAFAQVGEDQAREHEREPGAHDRRSSEVRKVRVERFDAGDGEDDAAEHEEAAESVARHERDSLAWIERPQHFPMRSDRNRACDRDRDKPHDHRRTEQSADAFGSAYLDCEQRDQHHDRERHDPRLEARRDDADSFYRRNHRDRGRDHPVAQQHRRADDDDRR
jgi:hypothetical protein